MAETVVTMQERLAQERAQREFAAWLAVQRSLSEIGFDFMESRPANHGTILNYQLREDVQSLDADQVEQAISQAKRFLAFEHTGDTVNIYALDISL